MAQPYLQFSGIGKYQKYQHVSARIVGISTYLQSPALAALTDILSWRPIAPDICRRLLMLADISRRRPIHFDYKMFGPSQTEFYFNLSELGLSFGIRIETMHLSLKGRIHLRFSCFQYILVPAAV